MLDCRDNRVSDVIDFLATRKSAETKPDRSVRDAVGHSHCLQHVAWLETRRSARGTGTYGEVILQGEHEAFAFDVFEAHIRRIRSSLDPMAVDVDLLEARCDFCFQAIPQCGGPGRFLRQIFCPESGWRAEFGDSWDV